MLCLYYNMFWELRKPHFDGTVQSKIVFPESEVFCRRLTVPVVFFCFIVVIVEEVVILTCGDVLTDVLLRYKGGSSSNDVAISESSLHSSNVPYCRGFDVLARVVGVYSHINFDVKCGEKDHDVLGCDGGYGARVGGCYSFCHCYCPFVVEFNFLVH